MSRWWWAIAGGSPAGERMEASLLAETAQSRQRGGYVRVQRTLVRYENDRALQVPVTGTQVVPTVPAEHHVLEVSG